MTGSSCRHCNAAQSVKASGTYTKHRGQFCAKHTNKRYAQFYNANIETVKTTGAGLNGISARPYSSLTSSRFSGFTALSRTSLNRGCR